MRVFSTSVAVATLAEAVAVHGRGRTPLTVTGSWYGASVTFPVR